ncbi:general substrate transporter [Ilyonectria sp. MPI-CAGE-AT-0026]|nr:general substrate transporter [Ilyonectria sp. MPI-CAGE-AT-0026]
MPKGNTITIASAAFLAVGGFLFGYDSGIISSTIALPHFKEYFNSPSDDTAGGIAVADLLGRKRTIFAGSVISLLGSALQAGSTSMAMLIVGRFIGGMAVGMLTSTIPMYPRSFPRPSGEAPSLVCFSGSSAGFLVAHGSLRLLVFSYGLLLAIPLAFQCIPALILVTGIWFLLESHVGSWRRTDTRRPVTVLSKLRNGENPSRIDLEFIEIRDVIAADREIGKVSAMSILTKSSWRKRLLLGCGVQAFGPLSGINVINYYGPRIYEILGIDTQTSLMIIGISGALSIVYCTIGLWMLDRVGRVKPLIVSAMGLAAALLADIPVINIFLRLNA